MFEVRMGRLVVFLLILIVGAAVGEVVTEAPTAAVINVDDDVEVAVVVGGWNSTKPILLRSDGVPCAHSREIPEYPQVLHDFRLNHPQHSRYLLEA